MKGLLVSVFNVRALVTLVCLSSFLYSAQVFSSPEVRAALEKMSESMRDLNYQGRFMYASGGDMASFEVQHAVIDGKEHERLVFLNQKQQEVVRVGHDVYCVHPGNHLIRQHQNFSANPFADRLSDLDANVFGNYELSIQGNKMVAGRDVYKVNFKSTDDHRYSHSLWIDKESHLLLKADVSDPMLGVLESFEYVQIDIGGEIPKSIFEHDNFMRHTPAHVGLGHDNPELGFKSANRIWDPVWLPKGFYLSGKSDSGIKSSEHTNDKLKMLMYTDGIAAITIFIEPVQTASEFSESSQMGAMSAYSHALKVDGKHYMVTAVGDVQLQTVERIAKGVTKHKP